MTLEEIIAELRMDPDAEFVLKNRDGDQVTAMMVMGILTFVGQDGEPFGISLSDKWERAPKTAMMLCRYGNPVAIVDCSRYSNMGAYDVAVDMGLSCRQTPSGAEAQRWSLREFVDNGERSRVP